MSRTGLRVAHYENRLTIKKQKTEALMKWYIYISESGVHVCVSSFLQAEKTGQDPKEATEVDLYMQLPPIEKMDASLSTIEACE